MDFCSENTGRSPKWSATAAVPPASARSSSTCAVAGGESASHTPLLFGDHAAQRGLAGVEAEGRLVPALVEGGPVAVEGVGGPPDRLRGPGDLLVVEEAAHQEAAVVLDARAHEGAVEPGCVDLGDGGDDVGERVVVGGRPGRPRRADERGRGPVAQLDEPPLVGERG